MKKSTYQLLSLALALLLLLALTVPASGEIVYDYLVDDADLVTSAQESSLRHTLDEVTYSHSMTVAIYTTESIGYDTPEQAAEDYCALTDFPFEDGILLLISMEYRDWCLYSFGDAEDIFNNAALDTLEEGIVPYLSDEDFAGAFETYASLCDEIFTYVTAKGSEDDGEYREYKESFDAGNALILALIVGFLVGIITVSVMKSKLKTVRARTGAAEYTRPGSMQMTVSRDRYLYRHVTRRPRPKQTSSGGGGGRSSGGGSRSGKF